MNTYTHFFQYCGFPLFDEGGVIYKQHVKQFHFACFLIYSVYSKGRRNKRTSKSILF